MTKEDLAFILVSVVITIVWLIGLFTVANRAAEWITR